MKTDSYYIKKAKEYLLLVKNNDSIDNSELIEIGKNVTEKAKIQVLSPDGFTIDFNYFNYTSLLNAAKAADKFCKRFELQGYYSSNYGRIDLSDLMENLEVKAIN